MLFLLFKNPAIAHLLSAGPVASDIGLSGAINGCFLIATGVPKAIRWHGPAMQDVTNK